MLRATSLDEMPELWNVIKGDMSIVGPRPLLMEYLPLYNSEQAKRHNVRPALRVMRKSMGAMPFLGKRNLNSIHGMLNINRYGSILKSC